MPIAPGSYDPTSLSQEDRNFLWRHFGHSGEAPVGYGGEDPESDILSKQRERQEALLAGQEAKTQAFLGRYTTGIAGAREAISTELGLPELRETTQVAGQAARGVSRQVQDIPGTQRTIAKQVGISAPRLTQRIAAETAELQPAAETARRGLEEALAGQQFGETEYTRRLQEFTQPFQLEASFLSEGLAREFSGFTQQMQNELELTMQKIANRQALTLAEITRATQLAESETEFTRQKELIGLQSQTDISQQQRFKELGLGTYYQKPGTAAGAIDYQSLLEQFLEE